MSFLILGLHYLRVRAPGTKGHIEESVTLLWVLVSQAQERKSQTRRELLGGSFLLQRYSLKEIKDLLWKAELGRGSKGGGGPSKLFV